MRTTSVRRADPPAFLLGGAAAGGAREPFGFFPALVLDRDHQAVTVQRSVHAEAAPHRLLDGPAGPEQQVPPTGGVRQRSDQHARVPSTLGQGLEGPGRKLAELPLALLLVGNETLIKVVHDESFDVP